MTKRRKFTSVGNRSKVPRPIMEIALENDAAKAKRQSILGIMRDTTLTSQEKQQRIQALHTAPDHAVAATAKKPSPEPSPEPSSSPSPPPEDAKPPAADQVAPESAPEVDLASPPTRRGGRRRTRANREVEPAPSSAMSVTPSPKPSATASTSTSVVAEDEPPEVAAARKRRDEVMRSAMSSSRTRAGTAGGGVRTGARCSRRRSVARIGRSSFADSASAEDDNDDKGEGKAKEEQRRNSGDSTPLMSAASRPATRRRRRLADVRAGKGNTRECVGSEDDFEDDRKPAAVQQMSVTTASAPSPMEADDRQQTRPGVVAVSAIDERIARKQSSNLGGTRNTAATATLNTVADAAAAPAAPVASITSASSSGAVRVGAFSCADLDDKIARKTAVGGRKAGAASAFSVSTSTNTTNRQGDGDNNINTGARSQSMMPSRTGNSLGGDGHFIPGSKSASMYTSRRQRRRRSGGGIDAGVGALPTIATSKEAEDAPEISNTTTQSDYENEETCTSQQQQKSLHDNKPHHICCKECGRPYTPPESVNDDDDGDDDDIKEIPWTSSGPESRRTLLTADSTAVSSGDDIAVGAVYEDVLHDVGENNPEQSGEWGSRHSGVLSTTGSGDWGSRETADTYDFEDDASGVPDGTRPIKSCEYYEESLHDEAKCNDEGDFRQSTISWGAAAAALNLDDMDLGSQGSAIDGEVQPPATGNVDCSVDDVTVRRGSLEHGVQGVSEESLAVEDLEKAAAEDRALKKDLHLIKEEGTYNEDDDNYYDYDEEDEQYHTEFQDSYNPAHQTDPFHQHSDHFFADDFMEKGPATRARARRESFKDTRTEGFVLSRNDKCNLFIGLLLIIVVTIGVSVPVTLIKKEANDAQNAPTMSPTLVRDPVYTTMLDKIVLETNASAEVFEDDESPQTQALQWIAYDDLAGLTADSPNLIQRYSLMCLFFGSGGSSTLLGWDNEDAEDECTWFGVKCGSDSVGDSSSISGSGNVTSLDLKRTRLAGSLVSEIGSLKHLESLNLGENFLKGAIPSTLYDLSKLQSLVLEKNFFGPYLTEGLGDLMQLEILSLNDNRFESELPTTIAKLKGLKNLYLFSNSFSGPLVKYILDMPALEVVDVANNMFTGTIVPSIGRLSNLRKFCIS